MVISGKNEHKTDVEKDQMIEKASVAYGQFLTALGYDWENDTNMNRTPFRVSKMYIKETTKGTYLDSPGLTMFDNNATSYGGMVFQGDIRIKSLCSHHMMPFFGKAHIAYLPGKKMIGLSKLNRVADWFARRPQVQENLTQQIHDFLAENLEGNKGIAIQIEAQHTCVSLRGIEHESVMTTSSLSGSFLDDEQTRQEFYNFIQQRKK